MIVVEKVTKTYGKGKAAHHALKDVDVSIDAGQFVAIIGTSGSGKTTLLNIIGGLDREFTGSVKVGGKALENLSDAEVSALRNTEFGFVFQHFHLLDHLTCLENVMLPSYFDGGKDKRDLKKSAMEVLERVGLKDKLDDRPSMLSGGQKQRVAIARALFNQPRLILCDEPTGSLDRKTGLQIMALFQDLVEKEELTLVVVTHEEHIAKMASRIIRLEDGEKYKDEANTPVMPDDDF